MNVTQAGERPREIPPRLKKDRFFHCDIRDFFALDFSKNAFKNFKSIVTRHVSADYICRKHILSPGTFRFSGRGARKGIK